MLTDYQTSGCCSSGLEAIGDTLFFRYNDGTHGSEMWRSDGTLAGTEIVDVCEGHCNSQALYYTAVGNTIYFLASFPGYGIELGAYDPTNITFATSLKYTFDFKLQVLEELEALFPSVDGADLFIDELKDDITFQYNANGTGTDLTNVTGATCSVSPIYQTD